MKQYNIRLQPLGKELSANEHTPLIDVLHEYGIEFPCGGKGTCGKCKVKLLDGEITINDTHQRKLDQLKLDETWRLACHSICTGDITLEIDQLNHLILADESEFDFTPKDGFGIAIDLGTTTIVAQLINLKTSAVIAVESSLNPQVKFGHDLISRIEASLNGKAAEITEIIRVHLGEMIGNILKNHPVELKKIGIVGNTVMQFIFSGIDLTPLSAYPFKSDNMGLKRFTPNELGWDFNIQENILFYPSIGSFVGSDILAGIAATGIHKKEKLTALIDLGTNGEIVVGNKNRIVCASTAAGPAFEGATISMGMRATTGAIATVKANNDSFEVTTIGNVKPKGICGSALIDAVATFRKRGMIGNFCEILSCSESIEIQTPVILTQKDLYEFQLAKAAIAAGLFILTKKFSVGIEDIDDIYIAGGFGSYVNIKNVVATGMIENAPEKIHKMGNTALIGAKMFLFEDEKNIDGIQSKINHVNLEGEPDFQEIYVDKMALP